MERRKERKKRREGRSEEMESKGEGSRRLPGLRRGRKKEVKPEGVEEEKKEKNRKE